MASYLGRDVGVLVQSPGRERDDVTLAPGEAAAIDDRLARALDHVVDGAAGVAMGSRALPRAEHLDPAGHGGQDGSSGPGVRVLERDAVVLVTRHAAQRRQRGRGRLPRVEQERRGPRPVLHPRRLEARMTVELDGGVPRLRQRHLALGVELEEHRVQGLHERDVEPVQPDHRSVGVIAVVVPGEARRQDEVARRHVDALPVDGRVGAVSLHDEADRRRRVTMGAGDLAGQEELDGGDHRVRRRPSSSQTGIEELQRPALLADRDDLARLADQRLDQRRLPHVRDRAGLGVTGHLARQLPEAVHVGGVHPLVKIALDAGHGLTGHGRLLVRMGAQDPPSGNLAARHHPVLGAGRSSKTPLGPSGPAAGRARHQAPQASTSCGAGARSRRRRPGSPGNPHVIAGSSDRSVCQTSAPVGQRFSSVARFFQRMASFSSWDSVSMARIQETGQSSAMS